jgi:hypothetical protein
LNQFSTVTFQKYIYCSKKFCDVEYTILKAVNSPCSDEGEIAVGDATKSLMNEFTILFLKYDLAYVIQAVKIGQTRYTASIPYSHTKKTPNS